MDEQIRAVLDAADRPPRGGMVRVRQQFEAAPADTDPLVPIQHGSWAFIFDREGDQAHKR